MRLVVENPGLFTTVQDLGRWGYQGQGVSVAGAMDIPALRLGNILLGNDEGAAALEITLLGPSLLIEEAGVFVLTGSELGLCLDGIPIPSWTVFFASAGSKVTFTGGVSVGCRGYLCVAGGVDVPLVMGSRSTYTRGMLGGLEGRALKRGDTLCSGELPSLAMSSVGLHLAESMRPDISNQPLGVLLGLQSDAFTEEGLATFFNSSYALTQESDRMGCRFEGPPVEHKDGADIISDAVTLGAIQVPGHGQPIAMLADRQTTGGYTKIGVLSPLALERLVQRNIGERVTFKRISYDEALLESRGLDSLYTCARELRASFRSRRVLLASADEDQSVSVLHWSMRVNGGAPHCVTIEKN